MTRKGFVARAAAAGACVALCLAAQAQGPLNGDPAFVRLEPQVEVYPQNFAIAQDGDGVLYVGNSDGVLTFDGSRWGLVALPNGDLARSLSYDGQRRVYVGGFDTFGYLQRDAFGRDVYHDLTPEFAELLDGERFGDIWAILVTPQGVFFRALRHVFLYRPGGGAPRLWRHAARFGDLAPSANSVLLQFRGEGLRQFTGDEWAPLPGSEPLTELIHDLVPLPDGGHLLLGVDGRWRVYRDGKVADFPVPAAFPPTSALMAGTALADGSLAFVSDDGRLYLLDPASGSHRRVRLDTEFLANTIAANDGGLLVAGESGVFHVDWPSPWTVIGPQHGLTGSLYRMARWDDRWFALTASGVRAVSAGADGQPVFRPMDWTDGEAWDLLPLDADSALLAESFTVKLVRSGRARPIAHGALYPRTLLRSRHDPDVVFVGTESGLAVLRRRAGTWTLTLDPEPDGDAVVNSIVEEGPGVLWLGTDRRGVARVRLSEDYSRRVGIEHMGDAQGITYGTLAEAGVARLPGAGLMTTTANGLFEWSGERFERTDLDGLEDVRKPGEWLHLVPAPDGALWAWSYNRVYRNAPGTGWRREHFGSVRHGSLESMTFDGNGGAIVCGTVALLRFDAAGLRSGPPRRRALVRAIDRLLPDGSHQPVPLDAEISLPSDSAHGGLVFRVAFPDYRRPEAVRFQTRLVGLEEQFSEWSEAPVRAFPYLPAGSYRFEVRARDSQGRVSETVAFPVTLAAPWSVSAWARTLWIAALLMATALMTVAFVRFRTRRLAAEKSRLQWLVAERTAELQAANRRLEAMAHRDGLTGIANRRELDRYLEDMWSVCGVRRQPLSVLAIDVDQFKSFNDQHGHVAGDEVLTRIAGALAACLTNRKEQLLARFGGDEFFAVLPDLPAPEARELAERMRRTVEEQALGRTVSVGVATQVPEAAGSVEKLVHAADNAMYGAKCAGKNRVGVAQ